MTVTRSIAALAAPLAAAFLLAACDGGAPDAAPGEGGAASPAEPFIEPAEETPADMAAATDAATVAIPDAFIGRWGLVAADCDPARDDAKGLMTVGAEGLSFYESRAVPTRFVERGEDTLRADFAFTGEGMEWTREMRLELVEAGTRLEREEFGDEAMEAELTYLRCPA